MFLFLDQYTSQQYFYERVFCQIYSKIYLNVNNPSFLLCFQRKNKAFFLTFINDGKCQRCY